MKKAFSLAAALVLAFVTASPASAEVRGGALTISPFVGGYTFDGVQHLKTSVASGVKLGYNLTGHWGVEGQFTYAPLRSTLAGNSAKGDLFSLRGDMLYHFMPEGRFVPLLALGGGWSRTSHFFDKNGNEDGVLDYGAGMKYFLNDWLALRGDVRHIFSFHPHNTGGSDFWQNVEYTAGLSFQFGGARAAVPAVATAPPMQEAVAIAPAPEVAKPAPSVEQPAIAPAPALPALQATEPAPAPPPAERPERAPTLPGKPVVTGIAIGDDGVEILSTEWIGDYRSFRLSQPARLVIDITGAVSGLGATKVPVNSFGFAAARIGSYPDRLRIVLDAAGKKLPPCRIVETDKGLKVIMGTLSEER